MNGKILTTTLRNLGLKETEAVVYLSALEQGYSTVLSLSEQTNIKRGTVYEITARLIDRGFLKVTKKDGHRYLISEDPKVLSVRFNEYAQNFTAKLSEFLALQNENETKPKITYYEGEDEVWQIYEDTLAEGKPICSFTSVIDIYDLLSREKIEDYIKRRAEKKIPIRIIALDSPESRLWAEKSKEALREMRLINKEQYNFSADVEIYGNKVATVSFKDKIFGVVVESEQISQMQKAAFELMWEGAEKYRNKKIAAKAEKSYDIAMTQEILKQKIIEAMKTSPYRDYIQSISLFGSYLHGEQKSDSDVDLLVHLKKDVGYFTLLAIEEDFKKRLGQDVDLVTPQELSHFFRDQVIKEAKVVYENR